jgi:hypothetical protein
MEGHKIKKETACGGSSNSRIILPRVGSNHQPLDRLSLGDNSLTRYPIAPRGNVLVLVAVRFAITVVKGRAASRT